MFRQEFLEIKTLGGLKQSGYRQESVKDEIRRNLLDRLRSKDRFFDGIHGYEKTVIPELENAILSRHNIILLGLRGQAKTRIARLLVRLLDEYVPVLDGSEVNDHPLNPISPFGKDLIRERGDQAPVRWIHRSERYGEKLATPDVTVADLVGDIDPIKAATQKLAYSDERILHYGIIPRTNRGIFVINELPDLQPRIQVSLFNILQEQDIQIRGFKTRIPMDILLIFTANPEDYTNRGAIITPLKDRIDSQIITHYPKTLEVARKITGQESFSQEGRAVTVHIPDMLRTLVEQISFEARDSEFIDHKSGVSARLAISALENLVSQAERRAVLNGETETTLRLTDLYRIVPSVTGKIELVYEGEQEGMQKVALTLISRAVKRQFLTLFPDPAAFRTGTENNPYRQVLDWFSKGRNLDLEFDEPERTFKEKVFLPEGLKALVAGKKALAGDAPDSLLAELVLEGLAMHSLLGRDWLEESASFHDMIGSMVKNLKLGEE